VRLTTRLAAKNNPPVMVEIIKDESDQCFLCLARIFFIRDQGG
jgi:hypothetical protein